MAFWRQSSKWGGGTLQKIPKKRHHLSLGFNIDFHAPSISMTNKSMKKEQNVWKKHLGGTFLENDFFIKNIQDKNILKTHREISFESITTPYNSKYSQIPSLIFWKTF